MAQTVTIQEAIKMLEAAGWRIVEQGDQFWQLQHDQKPGTVTLTGQPERTVPPGIQRLLRSYASPQEPE